MAFRLRTRATRRSPCPSCSTWAPAPAGWRRPCRRCRTISGTWQKRREQVRQDLTALLGLPVREPTRAKVLASHMDGDVLVENIIYLWAERCYVPGIVVRLPQSTGGLPALVVPPGFGGSSKSLDAGYYKPFVYQMARKGYLVLFFDDPSFGDRKAPLAAWYATTAAAGTQGMGVQVFDTLRALDYLLTRKDVDPGRIGVAGLCQGSEQTWLAGALEDRFQIVVPVCGTTTYTEWARMPRLSPSCSFQRRSSFEERTAVYGLAGNRRVYRAAAALYRQQFG